MSLGKNIVYSHPTCGYCDLLKEDLLQNNIEFTEIDMSKNPDKWSEVEKLTGGDRITPVMLTSEGRVEVGYKGIGCNYS
ncbi:MAG: UXX-star (seleno)protein family 2 [Dehalococcoidia bacterium]|jgi:glutaredoxin 3|nr:NrdH-redoxin [Chloroflexota bacterium]MDP7231532.1 UXX-star (seleno)protein family 2 [Dehalococcoidia bacterium]MDP7613155.1 UXX-star (seleno)protein family 2 [Dehalococcoidia bacterium]|tara:strand:+ start:393 stop:629 length:237 start_codon:yes stop_codon:yes gene_type:complete